MWEPRRLTTLWVFTACYRDSFLYDVKPYSQLAILFAGSLTLWGKVLLEKLIVSQPVNELAALHRTRRFISVFTKASQWVLF
jgi:hypothetical protein